jgi:hypothetical protein
VSGASPAVQQPSRLYQSGYARQRPASTYASSASSSSSYAKAATAASVATVHEESPMESNDGNAFDAASNGWVHQQLQQPAAEQQAYHVQQQHHAQHMSTPLPPQQQPYTQHQPRQHFVPPPAATIRSVSPVHSRARAPVRGLDCNIEFFTHSFFPVLDFSSLPCLFCTTFSFRCFSRFCHLCPSSASLCAGAVPSRGIAALSLDVEEHRLRQSLARLEHRLKDIQVNGTPAAGAIVGIGGMGAGNPMVFALHSASNGFVPPNQHQHLHSHQQNVHNYVPPHAVRFAGAAHGSSGGAPQPVQSPPIATGHPNANTQHAIPTMQQHQYWQSSSAATGAPDLFAHHPAFTPQQQQQQQQPYFYPPQQQMQQHSFPHYYQQASSSFVAPQPGCSVGAVSASSGGVASATFGSVATARGVGGKTTAPALAMRARR